MKYIKMSYVQIEEMNARQDGYDTVEEWRQNTPEAFRQSIYDLVPVQNMGFTKDGAKWYTFEDDKGRACVWFKY